MNYNRRIYLRPRHVGRLIFCGLISSLLGSFCAYHVLAETSPPFYKPSSSSPTALDISANNYGHSNLAPGALGIGETAPNFSLLRFGGGNYSLSQTANNGPVVIIFYRGHW
ncbi:MAG: peroxiredoxin family protein [Pseudomonadales bacterium]|nr:peroxiredoxin family protein [Pseudomonadales bacterium]